jgi:DNA-binding transcriptional regulator YiaG
MKNDIMAVTLDEITPEKLQEISEKMQDVRLMDLTLKSLEKVAAERNEAARVFNEINLDAQLRAMRAHSLGFTKQEIAEIFGMTTRQVSKWIGA